MTLGSAVTAISGLVDPARIASLRSASAVCVFFVVELLVSRWKLRNKEVLIGPDLVSDGIPEI